MTVAKDGSVRVDSHCRRRDCGVAINPDNVRAQVEGGVGFALSAVLYGEITLKDGQVEPGQLLATTPCCASTKCPGRDIICPPPRRPRASENPAYSPWRRPLPTPSWRPRAMP